MVKKYHPANERIKREYFGFLREAKRHGEATVDAAAKAIHLFEEYNRYKDFKAFHYEQAVAFKRSLTERKGIRSGERLSKSTIYMYLQALKRFFEWLALQSGYKLSVQFSEAEYFHLSEKDTRIATARREPRVPTLEQIKSVLVSMPGNNEIELRNRALIAFTLLTGARDSAIISAKLKHLDLVQGCFNQDARDVKTKFSKTFVSYFFPVGDDVLQILTEWVNYLKTEKLWGNDDPLFPSTKVVNGPQCQFIAAGLDKAHWSNASPIRGIFRASFERVGLQYFNPHSFRNTLARFGQSRCTSAEEFKAWSQNFGHEKVLTTFLNYGSVTCDRQGQILRSLGQPRQAATSSSDEIVEALMKKLKDSGLALPRS